MVMLSVVTAATQKQTQTQKKSKKLYRIDVSWKSSTYTLYRHAYNEEQAWFLASRTLSSRLEISHATLDSIRYNGDHVSITEERI